MKRLVVATLAVAAALSPVVAQAQPMHGPRHGPVVRHVAPRPAPVARHIVRPPARAHWNVGHRVPTWQRGHVVREYNRYGLRRPAAGQRWIQVDNEFLLVGVASGLIAALAAAN